MKIMLLKYSFSNFGVDFFFKKSRGRDLGDLEENPIFGHFQKEKVRHSRTLKGY